MTDAVVIRCHYAQGRVYTFLSKNKQVVTMPAGNIQPYIYDLTQILKDVRPTRKMFFLQG